MEWPESICSRNCFTKMNTAIGRMTLEGTRAGRLLKKNHEFLKKNDPEMKNFDFDPLEKDLDRFKGKFYGNVDAPLI